MKNGCFSRANQGVDPRGLITIPQQLGICFKQFPMAQKKKEMENQILCSRTHLAVEIHGPTIFRATNQLTSTKKHPENMAIWVKSPMESSGFHTYL